MGTKHWKDSHPQYQVRPEGNFGRALTVGLALAFSIYIIAALVFWIIYQ